MKTHNISRHASTNVLHAFDYAKFVGRPLNCYVVLSCDEESSGKTAAQICQNVRDRYRAWNINAAKRYGIESHSPMYVQTIEDPDGDNPHANWILHIPEVLFSEFLRKVPQWLRKAQGSLRSRDVSVQRVDIETDKTLAKYIVKGVDSHYVDYFHLGEFAEDQGVVEGRRTCVSPSIGRTARREAGFIPKLHRNEWKRDYKAPSQKPKRQIFINSENTTRLEPCAKVQKTLWGGLDLSAAQKSVKPAHTPPSALSADTGVLGQQQA
jgi:hypothetical protein